MDNTWIYIYNLKPVRWRESGYRAHFPLGRPVESSQGLILWQNWVREAPNPETMGSEMRRGLHIRILWYYRCVFRPFLQFPDTISQVKFSWAGVWGILLWRNREKTLHILTGREGFVRGKAGTLPAPTGKPSRQWALLKQIQSSQSAF